MDEVKVGDKVLIDFYGALKFNGIVASIDGDVVKGEITPHLKEFRAPKSIVFPIKEANNDILCGGVVPGDDCNGHHLREGTPGRTERHAQADRAG